MTSIRLGILWLAVSASAMAATANVPTIAKAPQPTAPPLAAALKRRANCPANMLSCPSSLGPAFSDICCSSGQTCALDNNNNPACCPSGAICTGVAPSGQATTGPSHQISYVSNSYFAFPYVATTFDNSAACNSAAVACSSNFDACTSNLDGNGQGAFGVTVAVPGGGGITVGGTAENLGASATSICSSLSSEACAAAESTRCDSYGSDTGTASSHRMPRTVVVFLSVTYAAILLLG